MHQISTYGEKIFGCEDLVFETPDLRLLLVDGTYADSVSRSFVTTIKTYRTPLEVVILRFNFKDINNKKAN